MPASGQAYADGDFVVDFTGPFFEWNFPWRPPDLRRFARTPQVGGLRSAADNWIELKFARIQAEASWLAPAAARLVNEYCVITGTNHRRSVDIGSLLGVGFGTAACVRCERQVAVAYGFDGAPADRILDLMRILEQEGWQPRLQTRRHMTDPQFPIRWVPGHSGAAIGNWHGDSEPPGFAVVGPRESAALPCRVHVVWTTRSHPSHTTLDPVFPPRYGPREVTPSYLPLEFSGAVLPTDISEFAAPALEQHEHAVAVMIELGYYENRRTAERLHRVPRRLKPKLW